MFFIMTNDSEIDQIKKSKMSRRDALSTAGKAAAGIVGIAIVGGAAYAVTNQGATPEAPVTVTQTQVQTATVTAEQPVDVIPDKEKLVFDHWGWGTEIIQDNAKIFNADYDENLETNVFPWPYFPQIETKLVTGAHVDMIYVNNLGWLAKWYNAGWILPLDNMPGVKEAQAQIYPGFKNSLTYDGHLLGLSYFADANSWYRNDKLLEQIGADDFSSHPVTPDEMESQARELKSKGICEYPILAAWWPEHVGIGLSTLSQMIGDGEDFVDKDFEPVLDTNTGGAYTLDTWRRWWKDELVAPESLTYTEGEFNSLAMSGRHAFMGPVFPPIYNSIWNTPAFSDDAGYFNVNKVNTSLTGNTLAYVSCVSLTNIPRSARDEQRAYDLIKFFGWKDDAGNYPVGSRWINDFALYSIFKDVNDANREFLLNKNTDGIYWMRPPGKDENYAIQQLDNINDLYNNKARDSPLFTQVWFPEWFEQLQTQTVNVIQDVSTIEDWATNLRGSLKEIKARYT